MQEGKHVGTVPHARRQACRDCLTCKKASMLGLFHMQEGKHVGTVPHARRQACRDCPTRKKASM